MRRVAIALLLLVAVALALAAGTALARPPATPALRVVKRTPLVVRGANFHSTERVTLRAPSVVRVVHTTASGVFRAPPRSGSDRPLLVLGRRRRRKR